MKAEELFAPFHPSSLLFVKQLAEALVDADKLVERIKLRELRDELRSVLRRERVLPGAAAREM